MTRAITKQVVFLRLRNRTLNRFKAIKKPASPVKKILSKKNQIISSASVKRTLRVIPKIQIRTIKAPIRFLKSIPARAVAKASATLISHRRVFLRNRRLMSLSNN